MVRDLGSTNGTFLNGARIGRAEQGLRKGDILQFGEITVIVDIAERPSPEEPGRTDGSMQVAGTVQYTFESLSQTVVSGPAPGATGKNPLVALIQTGRAPLPQVAVGMRSRSPGAPAFHFIVSPTPPPR